MTPISTPLNRAEADPRGGRWGYVLRNPEGEEVYRSVDTFAHPLDAVAAGVRKSATLPRTIRGRLKR